MKDWCLDHPYMTFFVIMSVIFAADNIIIKILDLFVKPSPPTTVNMNIDPSKLLDLNYASKNDTDESIH